MTDEIIILGKPNVGKSSIFNSIIGKKLALVENYPGITRDLRKKKRARQPLPFPEGHSSRGIAFQRR